MKHCHKQGCKWRTEIDSAKYCAVDGTGLSDEPRRSAVRKAVRVVGEDIGSFLTKAGRVAFKIIAYPTLGNLSGNLQCRTEDLLGTDNYDAVDATTISAVTNAIAYCALGGVISYSALGGSKEEVITAGVLGGVIFTYGIFEGNARVQDNFEGCASAPGKLVSLPIEGVLWTYGRARDYVGSVRKRVES